MNTLIEAAIHRSRMVFFLLGIIAVTGIYSYIAIPKESSPDIPLPFVYISVHHEGISPEDAVNLIVKPLEKELRNIEGLDELEASAYEGGANVMVKFQAGFDNKKALADVRNKVDIAKAELPEEADEPVVKESNISTDQPVLTVILKGTLPERDLRNIGEDLKDAIEGTQGVLEALLKGVREEQIVIEVDKKLLESYDVPPDVLLASFTSNNRMVAAGSLEMNSGRYAIKVPGLFTTTQEILNLPLITDGDNTIRVRDIATVKRTFKDAETITRVNAESAVTIDAKKRIGENIIETTENIKATVKKESRKWPKGLVYSFTADESKNIRNMLNDLQNSVAFAVILVLIVMLATLGPRPALLVAVAIPGSFLMAVAVLFFTGLTTNVVVLFGLIFSVGMLVDGAIVVTEMADKNLRAGLHRKEAFAEAAKYMALPIIASTATTLAAFFPLVFWPGIMGEFMKFLPLTLIYTLTASLFMALIFLPTIGANTGKPSPSEKNEAGARIANTYKAFLTRMLEMPGKVLLAAVGGFVASIVLYGTFGHGVEFFPNIEPESGRIKFHSRGDYSLAEKDTVMARAMGDLLGLEGADTLYLTTGSAERRGNTDEDVIGTAFIELHDWADRSRSAYDIFEEGAARVASISGVWAEIAYTEGGPQQGKPIRIAVLADDYAHIPPVASKIRETLEMIPEAVNVTDTLPQPGIEWAMEINREEIAKALTNVGEIGRIISMATTGAIISTYRPKDDNDEMDITVRFLPEQRTLETLDTLTIMTEAGRVPLTHFIQRYPQQKVSTIARLNQKTVAYVEADVKEGALADNITKIMRQEAEKISPDQLPPGTEIAFKGEDKDQKEAAAFLQKAFLMAIFIMTLILVTQFNSFYQAFIILSAVVLSTTGVMMGHLIMNKPFGIVMSGLGVIALAGVVVNNNIVLIDTYNKLSKSLPWKQALIETGVSRLRPVLLTAATTIIGLLPLALRINVDLIARKVQYNSPSTQWWDQLSSAIAFGLFFATILTLIITPCMIALPHVWREKRENA